MADVSAAAPPPNIEFDDVQMTQAMDGAYGRAVHVRWMLRGEQVRELKVTDDDFLARHGAVCPACLIWRGQLVEMNERRVIYYASDPGEPYTHAGCPVCKGLDFGLGVPPAMACFCGKIGHDPVCRMAGPRSALPCACGESPHRVHCPQGFANYFSPRVSYR